MALSVVAAVILCVLARSDAQTYVVDDTPGLGRRFDGIGGLSGGGVRVITITVYSAILSYCDVSYSRAFT